MSQLQSAMNEASKMTCLAVQEKFYQTLKLFIKQYYDEWTPKQYSRTEKFLNSAFKSEIVKISNGYECRVRIDTDSMNEYVNATGFQVADWANRGLHGGQDVGTDTHVWDDTIENTVANGDLVKLAKSFLIEKGFNIR